MPKETPKNGVSAILLVEEEDTFSSFFPKQEKTFFSSGNHHFTSISFLAFVDRFKVGQNNSSLNLVYLKITLGLTRFIFLSLTALLRLWL